MPKSLFKNFFLLFAGLFFYVAPLLCRPAYIVTGPVKSVRLSNLLNNTNADASIFPGERKGEKLSISGNLYNYITGPVVYLGQYKRYGDVRFCLYKKNNSSNSWRVYKEIDFKSIKDKVKIKTDQAREILKKMRAGYFEFTDLEPGRYKISFQTRAARFLGWSGNLMYENFEHFVTLGDKSIENLKIPVFLSSAGKFFYYTLICISFLTFFIGISLIVIQHIAFKDLPFLSIFGMSILFLSWAVILNRIPGRAGLPIFLVQFAVFLPLYFKKDLSDLPLPFLTKSFIGSKKDYLYNGAFALSAVNDRGLAELRFQDKWHNRVIIKGKCFKGEGPIAPGTEVYLIEYDEKSDFYYVQSSDQITEKEGFISHASALAV
jgi:hypothetical protein